MHWNSGTWIPGPSQHLSVNHLMVGEEGVFRLLTSLQVHKAMGPDELPTRPLLKEYAELTPVFTLFYQTSLGQDIIPDDWKIANGIPTFKKGDRNRAENYRSVSPSSVACKTLSISCKVAFTDMGAHSILTDAQHGFRKRHFLRCI